MDLKALGLNIRKYRKACKLSQEKLAEIVEVSTNYIGQIERGEKMPALDTFLRILNALNASADLVFSSQLTYMTEKETDQISKDIETAFHESRDLAYAIATAVVKHKK